MLGPNSRTLNMSIFLVLSSRTVLEQGIESGAVYATNGADLLKGFYGRLLAASAIVDVASSTIIAGLQRLYLQKHPDLVTENRGAGSDQS